MNFYPVKIASRLILVSGFSFSVMSVAQAGIFCKSPVFSEPVKNDKLYEFRGSIECQFSHDREGADGTRKKLMSYWESEESTDIRSVDKRSLYQGVRSWKLNLSEAYDSGHGKITIYSDVFLPRGSTDSVQIEFMSTSIDAKDDARYTKYESKSLLFSQLSTSQGKLVFKKFVQVKKPVFAPSSVFKKQVLKGIGKSLNHSAENYIKAIQD